MTDTPPTPRDDAALIAELREFLTKESEARLLLPYSHEWPDTTVEPWEPSHAPE